MSVLRRRCRDPRLRRRGNVHDHEYELGFWSGQGFKIFHECDECPIDAPVGESEGLGGWIYESTAEAEAYWNRRAHEEGNR